MVIKRCKPKCVAFTKHWCVAEATTTTDVREYLVDCDFTTHSEVSGYVRVCVDIKKGQAASR